MITDKTTVDTNYRCIRLAMVRMSRKKTSMKLIVEDAVRSVGARMLPLGNRVESSSIQMTIGANGIGQNVQTMSWIRDR